MTDFSKTIMAIRTGKVLDVATGSGGFIHFLLGWPEKYTEWIETGDR